MPQFLTIGYGDEAGYEATAADVRQRAHDHDAEMQGRGALVSRLGPPVTVRNPDDRGPNVEDGAFMRADLPVAGIALIEAATLDEAISLVAKSPCAVAQGAVEVWPLVS